MGGNVTWIDTELDAQYRLISFLLFKKNNCGPEEKQFGFKRDEQ